MIQNYLKIILRNLKKDKWYSLISVTGLAIGITASLLIYIHISFHLSYDDFHNDSDNIYRLTRSKKQPNSIDYEPNVPYPAINALNTDFSQFKVATQLHLDQNPLVSFNDEKFLIDNAIFADTSFLEVFNYKVIKGSPKDILSQPNFAMITESTARKLFGDKSPMGEEITLRQKLTVTIAGIMEDPPKNSHLQFNLLVSYPSFLQDYFMLPVDTWTLSADGFAYVRLKDGASKKTVNKELERMVNKYYSEDNASKRKYHLQALSDIHFDQKWNSEATNTKSLWALGVIGAFILLIGCVNFINLSTALAINKSKEVGVRKTLGATKPELIRLYLLETFIVTFASGIISLGLTERLIPVYNQFFENELSFSLVSDFHIVLFVLGLVLFVTLIAGLYPSMVLSSFNPTKALKSNIHSQSANTIFLRKGLIMLQFVISQILIICTIVVAAQMEFFNSKPLGYDKNAVINISLPKNDLSTIDRVGAQLEAIQGVDEVSFSIAPPTTDNSFETGLRLAGKGESSKIETYLKPVDRSYMSCYGLELTHGTWFTEAQERFYDELRIDSLETLGGQSNAAYVINETAAKSLGFPNPEDILGEKIVTGLGGLTAPVVGIIKDFHGKSLHEEIKPTVFLSFPMFYYDIGIKLNQVNEGVIAQIEEVHQRNFPDNLFEYDFLDDSIAQYYKSEQQTFTLFKIASTVSIIICSLGLIGMISFILNQRSKEMAVRKVLGSSIHGIVLLFSKEFIVLVVIAFIISAPVAYYGIGLWLNDFAYRVDFHFGFFALAILISIGLTMITIGYQTLRAALTNPVDRLRDE